MARRSTSKKKARAQKVRSAKAEAAKAREAKTRTAKAGAKRPRGVRTAPPDTPPAKPRVGGIVVMASGPLQQAREACRNELGSHFAAKASDALLLAMGRAGGAREFAAPAAAGRMRGRRRAPVAQPLVLEMRRMIEVPPAAGAAGRSRVLREAARVENRETRSRKVGAPQILRQTQLIAMRDDFYKAMAPLYAEIGRRSGASAAREAVGSRRMLDMCWLNETIRTAAPPRALAEIAPDENIEQIDLPRRLVREMRVCAPLVGAPAFRLQTGFDGDGIVVAVIDGEVDAQHPALRGRVMQKRNLTREPFGFPDEHGTAVAGIIAADDKRFAGIAPAASILSYKVFATNPALDADDFDGSLAIQQALEDGAHVANCSWGAGPAGDGTGRQARACDRAWSLGMVIVKSAGNAGPHPGTLTTPADAEGVIVVGATDRNGRRVESYSSRGPTANRERPHLVAPGGSELAGIQTCRPGGKFGSAGHGTSFAAPHVAGLAALILDRNPHLLPDAVRKALVDCCTPLKTGDVNTQGAGLIKIA